MTLAREMALESEYVMGTFARKPVEFVEGHGMTLIDDAGNEYLDFLSGIGVCSLGHCHPSIVQAVSDQAAKLIHVSNYYYIEHRGEVAQLLSNMLNAYVDEPSPETWKTFFANSGAEANECAIKLARLYARRRTEAAGKDAELAPRLIVTLAKSFHGRTLATLAATAQPAKQEAFQPLPAGFTATPINDVEALERLFETQGDRICAVMIECIQGESGVHPCTEEFIGAIRRLTEEHGALMICDEVQSGIFRTGLPYGFQNFGVLPDIVTMAKGIASGFPMGACAARIEVAEAFEPGDHGSTFGGSNLAMAAAHATLATLSRGHYDDRVTEVGDYFAEKLAQVEGVTEVRGMGLMLGADLEEGIDAHKVVAQGLEEGFLLNATGSNTLRFLPPLIVTETEIDKLIDALPGMIAAVRE